MFSFGVRRLAVRCRVKLMNSNSQPDTSSRALPLPELLRQAELSMAAAGVARPVAEAQLLWGHVLGLSRGEVQAAAVLQRTITPEQQATFAPLLHRRLKREPLQHILGYAYFYGLPLAVGPGVFVPRPETELLAELALNHLNRYCGAGAPKIADFCAGSGALAFALQRHAPGSTVTALEKSPAAFSWLQRNKQELKLETTLLQVDLAAAAHQLGLRPLAGSTLTNLPPVSDTTMQWFKTHAGSLDVLVSNPPYVPRSAVPETPEVRDYDPELALYSGADGLELLRWLVPLFGYLAAPGAFCGIEHTEVQGSEIAAMLQRVGFTAVETVPDLTSRPRFTVGVYQQRSLPG